MEVPVVVEAAGAAVLPLAAVHHVHVVALAAMEEWHWWWQR